MMADPDPAASVSLSELSQAEPAAATERARPGHVTVVSESTGGRGGRRPQAHPGRLGLRPPGGEQSCQ
jgi:hypothetical protein